MTTFPKNTYPISIENANRAQNEHLTLRGELLIKGFC